MQKPVRTRIILFVSFFFILITLGVQPVQADGIAVNTAVDENNTGTDCSLREAITAANTNAAYGGCPAGSGSDAITFAGDYTITLSSQLPAVTTTISITGNGAANTIIQADLNPNTATYRVFEVGSTGDLTLDGLTVRNGRCDGSCATASEYGGGIYNSGALSVSNVTFSANSANARGGGMYNDQSNPTLTNVTFSGNGAFSGGGMYNDQSNPTLTNVTFSVNGANYGGGMYNQNSLPTLTNATFSGNSASINGGGMYNFNNSSPTLTNVTFSGNTANGNGGGMLNTGIGSSPTLKNVILSNSISGGDCINLEGALLNEGSSNNLIEDAANACGLTDGDDGNIIGQDPALGALANNGGPTQTHALLTSSPALNTGTNTGCPSTDQRGVARPYAILCDIGAVEANTQQNFTLVVNTDEDSDDGFCDEPLAGVTDCTLREAMNYANNTAGTWTITFADDSTITLIDQLPAVTGTIIIQGNGATNTILQADTTPNTANRRVFFVSAGGTLTLQQVTVRHGVCSGGCAVPNTVGGGIYVVFGGTLTINNSHISANYAADGGAGLYNGLGLVTITNSTFSDNTTPNAGGAITNQGTMTISNSTVANNAADSENSFAGGINNIGTLDIYNSTISGNTSTSAVFDGSNIYQGSGALNLYNTIIANGTDGDCAIIDGTVSATNSLIESTGLLACDNISNGSNGNIIGSDPNLGTLTGSPAYFPLNAGSLAFDAGDNTTCAAAPVNNESQNGVTRPQGANCDIGAFELPISTLTLRSIGSNDGWIRELNETSNSGGTMNDSATTLVLGDDASDRQYRVILHFDTSGLPDNAVITSAVLKLRQQSVSGTNPFAILNALRADMRRPDFGAPSLQLTDFAASAARNNAAVFSTTPVNNWYSGSLTTGGMAYIHRTGTTQFKLYFSMDDNNDNGTDIIKFFSGDAKAASRPRLVITYYVP